MPKSNPGTRQSRDWNQLKNQFIQSNLSFRKFCRQYKLNYSVAYRHCRREKWDLAKKHYQSKLNAGIEKKAVRDWVKTWDTLTDTWDALLKHARASLRPIHDASGELRPVGVETQAKVANVLDHITHNLRLLAGKSTENVESKDPELEGLKNDLAGLNKAIAREVAEIEKLQGLAKRKPRK